MHFGSMSEKGTIDAVFILGRMQEEYHADGKKVVYVFCGPRESFDRVRRKVLSTRAIYGQLFCMEVNHGA